MVFSKEAACLDSDMVQMAQCIKTCRDCTDLCALCARFMARGSDLHAQMCAVCIEACDRYAAECKNHDHGHAVVVQNLVIVAQSPAVRWLR